MALVTDKVSVVSLNREARKLVDDLIDKLIRENLASVEHRDIADRSESDDATVVRWFWGRFVAEQYLKPNQILRFETERTV